MAMSKTITTMREAWVPVRSGWVRDDAPHVTMNPKYIARRKKSNSAARVAQRRNR